MRAPAGRSIARSPSTPVKDRAVLGADYWQGDAISSTGRQGAARTYCTAHVVWSLDRDLVVGISHGGQAQLIQARRVIIATGALERPFPIPGWTLPGVMTVGAAQTLLKSSGLVPAGRTVMAGMGPLLWLYAAQILRAGGSIEAILDTTPRGNWLRALRHAPAFVLSPLRAKAWRWCARCREGACDPTSPRFGPRAMPRSRVSPTTASGAEQRIDVDTLLLHQGVVPNVNLAMAAGVAHRWDDPALLRARARRDRRHIGSRHRHCGRRRRHRRRLRRRRARPLGGHRCVRALEPEARVESEQTAASRCLRAMRSGARFPRRALPAAEAVPRAGGRNDRLPLRGGDRGPDPRHGRARLRGAEPDEGVPALRHGAVPGPAVRPDRHRADRGRARGAARGSATTACARR